MAGALVEFGHLEVLLGLLFVDAHHLFFEEGTFLWVAGNLRVVAHRSLDELPCLGCLPTVVSRPTGTHVLAIDGQLE